MMRGFVFSKPTCSAMTESVSEPQEQSAALPADAAAGTVPQAAASADGQGRKRSRRGGRGRNKGKATEPAADAEGVDPVPYDTAGKKVRAHEGTE